MTRNALTVGALASLALFAACQAGTEAPPPASAPAPAAPPAAAAPAAGMTTMAGVYTAAQVDRGLQVFNTVCSDCHDTADWQAAAFLGRWSGESLGRLFWQIHDTMPYGAPASLTPQQYADVVSYILSLNNVPAGSAELTEQSDALNYRIEWGGR
jgi:mono/diheme cytochrome c family protein